MRCRAGAQSPEHGVIGGSGTAEQRCRTMLRIA